MSLTMLLMAVLAQPQAAPPIADDAAGLADRMSACVRERRALGVRDYLAARRG